MQSQTKEEPKPRPPPRLRMWPSQGRSPCNVQQLQAATSQEDETRINSHLKSYTCPGSVLPSHLPPAEAGISAIWRTHPPKKKRESNQPTRRAPIKKNIYKFPEATLFTGSKKKWASNREKPKPKPSLHHVTTGRVPRHPPAACDWLGRHTNPATDCVNSADGGQRKWQQQKQQLLQ